MEVAKFNIAIVFMTLVISAMGTNTNSSKLGMSIGRSVDSDEIHYYIQLDKKGNLNEDEPLKIYWKNNSKNQLESMNWIKKKYGYNAIYFEKRNDFAKFYIVSYDKRHFTLKKDNAGQHQIFTYSKGKEIMVQHIFVYIEGGSLWIPNVTHVDLYGESVATGKPIHEIIYP